MKEGRKFPRCLKWPRWKCPSIWFTVLSFALALINFLILNLEQKYRFIIGILLLISPILIQTFLWIIKTFVIIFKRISCYSNLYNKYQMFKESISILWKNCIEDRLLEIYWATYQGDEFIIVLKNSSKLNIEKGNKILVFDKRDAFPMGQFEITDVRDDKYYAICTKNIDPVWLGYVKQVGETRAVPYYIAAIYLPSGE